MAPTTSGGDGDATLGKPQGVAADKSSERNDDSYFGYYALLSHQAQMLQDAVRTAAYQRAILGHANTHFKDKLVMDVGAGNGILSIFAVQAGARRVYAVEASNMVRNLRTLVQAAKGEQQFEIDGKKSDAEDEEDEQWFLEAQGFDAREQRARPTNPWLAQALVPVHSKVEDVTTKHLDDNNKVDTIVSECLGVLLVHERMCESFIDARDRFLKPGGALFPNAGTICFSPFEDATIFDEVANKARFWQSSSFYGVDLQPFFASAWREAFASPVVGCFNAHTLIAGNVEHHVDFETIKMEELRSFEVPLDWTIRRTALLHGIGGWFDLQFQPSASGGVSMGTSAGDVDSDATADTIDEAMGDASQGALQAAPSRATLSHDAPAFHPSGADSDVLAAAASATATAHASIAASTPGQLDSADPIVAAATQAFLSDSLDNTSTMSTAPYCTPTHWQQARLLFPEPLAVNRGQRVTGKMTFVVNDQRSYDITAEIFLRDDAGGESTAGSAAGAKAPPSKSSRSTKRKFAWHLDRQYYSFTTSNIGQTSSYAAAGTAPAATY